MNKDNFAKLIKAIEKDGRTRFSMSCFIGKIDAAKEVIDSLLSKDLPINTLPVFSLENVETTEMFNCDSVGCIAGFATALANDWKTPEFLQEDKAMYEEHWQSFEEEANSFLGLTALESNNLYYSKNTSVWKMVKWHEPERYPKLEWDEPESVIAFHKNNNQSWKDNNAEIDLQSIDYKAAVDVLTRIMNGEIMLGNVSTFGIPQYVEKEV